MIKHLLISLLITGSAAQATSTSEPTYVRNTQGQTVAKIQDGRITAPNGSTIGYIRGNSVYAPNGSRVANTRGK